VRFRVGGGGAEQGGTGERGGEDGTKHEGTPTRPEKAGLRCLNNAPAVPALTVWRRHS
jgi:hypothetical protein